MKFQFSVTIKKENSTVLFIGFRCFDVKNVMTFYCLVILSLILPLSSICTAQASSFNNGELSVMKIVSKNNVFHQHQVDSSSLVHDSGESTGVTENFRSGKGQNILHRKPRLMRNAHGVLNIIGWGTLLPMGVIISRYFRKFPLKSDDWYPLHVLCQTSGYIVGTIGWGIGLWLGNSSKHYTLKTHRILGILVFTFATVQMLTAVLLQARREDECRRCWEIYHHVMGYAVIGLSIANIFQGIMHQTHAERWKLVYVGILAVLACVVFALEIIRWIIKSRIQQQMAFENNMYNFST
ncbi:cytochrome b561 and DOMON domain-containing protein At4g12980-like isoform X2 [Pistacia vera]|uniref:cytochrome b561 and DOMON domain-containing protein At4g12980-like isoform X2 n=1 Tax=Pistacia vera TaxID=55513 RepID=UPI001263B1DD|nr:cytochrome b561 and DOMON domain-containing protein At4g12980-like isoform X2 [Pistacia vera]